MEPTTDPALRKMIRSLFLPILAGLLTTQVIATGFVYRANKHLYDKIAAAENAGYFVIPAGPVTETLTSLKSAALGGLFYTLSIGVGLTLLTWALLTLWHMLFKRNRALVGIFLLIWAGILFWINAKGVTLYPTLFCILVPLTTAWTLLMRNQANVFHWHRIRMVPVATLVLLTAIWATQLDTQLFTAIRDHVLLSNPVGRSVNDFYYRYTLYPAESFKSLSQMNMRSYHITPPHDATLIKTVTRRMAQFDMLHLPEVKQPDFIITINQGRMLINTTSGIQVETTLKAGMAKPNQWLQQLSRQSDRHAHLRRLTLVGLLLGFPILLYVMVYGGVRILTGRLLEHKKATFAASGVSLMVGLVLFIPMLGNQPTTITANNVSQNLGSDEWPHRVAALRYIEQKKIDIGRYPQYKHLLESQWVVERYYLARALASSRSQSTYNDLKSMLGDSHPNVTCQVYYALGRRGQRTAIAPILSQIATSDHWYTQWYGYRALRRLGWYPSPSKQSP